MTSTNAIVTRELNRIEAMTDIRPIDWMAEVEEEAWKTWIEGNEGDVDSVEMEIINNADTFIDYVKTAKRLSEGVAK